MTNRNQNHEPPAELLARVKARNGRREGKEYRFRCPYPDRHANGDADPSARYNHTEGVWCCDVCKAGGGWKELAGLLGISLPAVEDPRRGRPSTYGPSIDSSPSQEDWPPSSPPPENLRHPLYGAPDHAWRICDGRGRLFGVHARWNQQPGKQVRWWRNGRWRLGDVKLVQAPLYGAENAPFDRERPVFVVEGERAADALRALGLQVVGTVTGAGSAPSAESLSVLIGMRVVLWPDKDDEGIRHMEKIAQRLRGRCGDLRRFAPTDLPPKGDAVEWIEAQGAADSRELATQLEAAGEPISEPNNPSDGSASYEVSNGGLFYLNPTKNGPVPVALTNFNAEIIGEVIRDDGLEERRSFELETNLQGQVKQVVIPAEQFANLSWVLPELGPGAVVFPGQATKDRARAAIQLLSTPAAPRRIFTHLGWREIDGTWCYLHAGGVLGPEGPISRVEVTPPSQLEGFSLPEPPSGDDLVGAVQASLHLLDLVPYEVSFPLFCSIWCAVLGEPDFSLHLAGHTGEGKSELVALIQQHFGPGLDARHLPGSWSSTANSLEVLAFAAKDAVLVVDDFAPEGSSHDVQRLHASAARLLRAQGNRAGRNRLRPDGTLRPVKYPRGLILSTGEDVPKAHSIRARTLLLDLPQGGMNWNLLSGCQEHAAAGLYAQSLAGFVRWLSARYGEMRARRTERTRELRDQASGNAHRRTPSTVAELTFGLESFSTFARESGALDAAESEAFVERGAAALEKAAFDHEAHLGAADPSLRFLDLLSSALVAGGAHVADEQGNAPPDPEAWGWRTDDRPSSAEPGWRALGDRVGWLRAEDLFLDPASAFRAAQNMAAADSLTVTATTLWKRMKERGFLATVDSTRTRNLIRVQLQGKRRSVLHLTAETISSPEKPAQSAHPAPHPRRTRACGTVSRDGSDPVAEEPAHETGPQMPGLRVATAQGGPSGPGGPLFQEIDGDDDEETIRL